MLFYGKTFKNVLLFGGSALALAALVGCSAPEPEKPKPKYQPTALEEGAKGITIATSKPYNCRIEGETDVEEEVGDASGATRSSVRGGALNKLKNEASYVVKDGKKIMIAITKEESRCKFAIYSNEKDRKNGKATKYEEGPCPEDDYLPNGVSLVSYKIYGYVYECGTR